MSAALYMYRARVRRVVDGDTVRLDVDLGFGLLNRGEDAGGLSIRLLGVNARELYDPGGGQEAKANLALLLPVDLLVTIRTVKVDKYGGRYDAAIALEDGRDVATLLIFTGWAAPWNGTGTRPVPPWPRP